MTLRRDRSVRGLNFVRLSIHEIGDLGGADMSVERERESENDAVACGSGPLDRASDGVQVVAGGGGENALRSGESDSGGGVERTTDEVPGDGVW